MDEEIRISLRCMFCSEALQTEENVEFEEEDLIECASCGEANLYGAAREIAIEKGKKIVLEQLKSDLQKSIGKHFK